MELGSLIAIGALTAICGIQLLVILGLSFVIIALSKPKNATIGSVLGTDKKTEPKEAKPPVAMWHGVGGTRIENQG